MYNMEPYAVISACPLVPLSYISSDYSHPLAPVATKAVHAPLIAFSPSAVKAECNRPSNANQCRLQYSAIEGQRDAKSNMRIDSQIHHITKKNVCVKSATEASMTKHI